MNQPATGSEAPPPDTRGSSISTSRIVVWAVLSFATIAYLALGTVDARIWRFNRLRVDSKEILGIWTLQGDRLPSVTFQWILTSAYFVALVVFVIGVLAAFWLLLDDSVTDDGSGEPTGSSGVVKD